MQPDRVVMFPPGIDQGASILQTSKPMLVQAVFSELAVETFNKCILGPPLLEYIGQLYAIAAEAKDLTSEERQHLRQAKAAPIIDEIYHWLVEQRQKVPKDSATSKAINYSLKRW